MDDMTAYYARTKTWYEKACVALAIPEDRICRGRSDGGPCGSDLASVRQRAIDSGYPDVSDGN